MTVYIKREDAIDAVLDIYYNTSDIDLGGERLEAAILNIPAADVAPVVRCQNCMYWTKMKDSAQGRCALLCHYPTGGWYCANGERKEDA